VRELRQLWWAACFLFHFWERLCAVLARSVQIVRPTAFFSKRICRRSRVCCRFVNINLICCDLCTHTRWSCTRVLLTFIWYSPSSFPDREDAKLLPASDLNPPAFCRRNNGYCDVSNNHRRSVCAGDQRWSRTPVVTRASTQKQSITAQQSGAGCLQAFAISRAVVRILEAARRQFLFHIPRRPWTQRTDVELLFQIVRSLVFVSGNNCSTVSSFLRPCK